METKMKLPIGTETGLRDSNGRMICVGDKVKIPVTANIEFHGKWSIYEVELKGIVPVLLYVTSEKGTKFPRGYTGCALSTYYDQKEFLFAVNLDDIRPGDNDIYVIDTQSE